MKDDMNIGNALEMHPSQRSEGLTMVVVDEYFKLSSYDDGEERDE
jgi:hypothetical protein